MAFASYSLIINPDQFFVNYHHDLNDIWSIDINVIQEHTVLGSTAIHTNNEGNESFLEGTTPKICCDIKS